MNACRRSQTLFESIPASKTGLNFENKTAESDRLNILYYLYYYNGAGVATADFDGDGMMDIYFAANNKAGNKLFRNKGNLQFEDITESAGVSGSADWSSGVTVADVNGDGKPDIYVCAVAGDFGLQGRNMLFINQGSNKFSEEAARYGLDFVGLSTQAAFFDYDHDGDLDCYLLNHSKRPHANLVPASNRAIADSIRGDRLLRNELAQGKTGFTNVSAAAGIFQSTLGYGLGLAVADFDADGWDDIYVGNDFHENDYLYLNQQNGTFKEVGKERFGHYSRFSMGNDAADINNDGHIDLMTVDMLPPDEKTLKTYGSDESLNSYLTKLVSNGYQHQVSRNALQLNLGNGVSFTDIALQSDAYATDWSWSPLFADFDHDGNKDLLVTSGIVKRPVDLDYVQFVSALSQQKGMDATNAYDQQAIEKMPDGASPVWFFRGNGEGLFSENSEALGMDLEKGYFNGSALADFDLDGDLDVVINRLQGSAVLLQNQQKGKPALRIVAEGPALNRFGIGCKVYAFAGSHMQYQQLQATHGFMSASLGAIHMALPPKATAFDSLVVQWPGGKSQTIIRPDMTKPLVVRAADATGNFQFKRNPSSAWEDITNAADLRLKHEENAFLDFDRQYLIPQFQSNRGPALAVADVNGDGLQDIFLGGSMGSQSVISLQQSSGKFLPPAALQRMSNSVREVTDAVFFDANADGLMDLYTVSGGGELEDGHAGLQDIFYANKGGGKFIMDSLAIPNMPWNKSCVQAWDADGDGDSDLFVGGGSSASIYGVSSPSVLLINNGKGRFSKAPATLWPFDTLGIVTCAAIGQVAGDARLDLVVAGEWMPVQVFEATDKGYKRSEIAGSSGLWQSVLLDDTNGDGLLDILAGNWGLNSKRAAGKDGPLQLFVKDFDKNGRTEHIMTYRKKGEDYTFFAKDELERAVPELKKYYLTYGEVAGKTVNYMFFNLFEGYRTFQAELLASGTFIQQAGGGWQFVRWPDVLQRAPVFAMAKVAQRSWLIAGNFSGVSPYEGRYDALRPTLLSNTGAESIWQAQVVLPNYLQEIRAIRSIQWRQETAVLIAANNDSLRFIKPKIDRP